MAGKTDRTAVQYAFKKLSGRANTSNIKSDAQELIGSNVQAGTQTLFGQDIPLSASRRDYQIFSASNGGPTTAEYVVFTVASITGTTYDADSATGGGGDGSQTAGAHGYKLIMTGNYTSLSSNPKAGSYPFTNGTLVHETLGRLQLIPPNFSQDAPNPYILKIYEADSSDANEIGDEIPLLDEVDWTFDYYNGILFLQDFDSSKIPAFARGFIYVGDYLSASLGSATGTPGGASSQVQFNDGGAFGGDSTFTFNKSTDALKVTNLSGSLTHLSNGTSYLVAGSNVTITSSSSGQVTISSTGGGGGGTGTVTSGSFNVPSPGEFVTTASVSFAGAQGFNFTADSVGTDTYFFASGAVDSRGTGTPGTAVFGGDLAISGTLAVNLADSAVGSQFVVTTDGKVGIGTSTPAVKLSVGGNMEVGEYINHKNDSDTFIRFQADDIEIEVGGRPMIKMSEGTTDQVLVMSGGGRSSPDPKNFADANFFVSGTIGSQNSSTAGSSVFGGDVVVSGALDAKQGVGTIKTATSVIHVSASNAPISGSVLVAKSSTEAAWQQSIVFGEQPSGTKNGSNLTFSLDKAPINGTDLMLFVNGLLQLSGTSGDYELTGSTINFKLAPFSDDSISAIYRPST
tara:strand:- start:3355 stop:5235 length:1881 start_codon:yes stop_codon:yes gene_type:complete